MKLLRKFLSGFLLLFLLISIPLAVWGIAKGNFQLHGYAATAESPSPTPIGTTTPSPMPTPSILPTPTVLPTPTIMPTPSPIPCTRFAPTLIVSPNSQVGLPGQALTYNISFRNNDSTTCPVTTFSFTTFALNRCLVTG